MPSRSTRPTFATAPALRWGRALEAALSAACTGSVIVWRPHLPVLVSAALAFGAAVLAIDLARREARNASSVVPIACAIAALFAVAVARAPTFPTDIRSYAADGRILARYHQNPYVVTPGRFPGDPLFSGIHDTTAPYGPLFVGPAAVVARIAGDALLGYRLAYQAVAALAIGGALALLWRVRRSTSAIALVGLHPVVAGTIVNGGHNDALVALALLAAVLATERRRFIGSGLLVAGAILVKVTAGLAVVPLAVWAGARVGRRALVGMLGAIALTVVPVTLGVPGMLRSIRSANLGLVTRTSIWNLDPLRAPLLARFGEGAVTQLGLICIAIAVIVISRSDRDLSDQVTGCLAAGLVLSAYVMPWYTVWALPVAALHPGHRFTRVVAWQGTVAVTAFLLPQSLLANHAVSLGFGWIAPVALLIAFTGALRDRPEVRVAGAGAGAAVIVRD